MINVTITRNTATNKAKDAVYVFGHKNPDTDSICSAIAYAHLKRELGLTGALAYRLGEINKETEFVLKHFGVEAPELLRDVKMRVEDLDIYTATGIFENAPVKAAWDAMRTRDGSRLTPVTCPEGVLKGIIGLGDVTEIFMYDDDPWSANACVDHGVSRHYEILYENLIKILGGKEIGGTYKHKKLMGSLYVGVVPAGVSVSDKDIIICGTIEDAWKLAYQFDFGCIILAGGVEPRGLENARCAIVCCDASIFKAVTLIKQAISASSVMNSKDMITFSPHTYVDDVIAVMRGNRFRNFPIVNEDGTLFGVISRRHVMGEGGKKVIMIDHNERSQSAVGIEQANIIEIIDHHRLADIQTNSPLYSRFEPVGSTATIVYKMYKESGVAIPKDMAGLMLSAILSDTLNFSSPTCTFFDKGAGEELAELAEVTISDYAREMFRAGTNLDEMSIAQMLGIDRKRFTFGNIIAFISQINAMEFDTLMHREAEIIAELEKFYNTNECHLAILMITDIIRNGSELFVIGKSKDIVDTAFGMYAGQNHIYLPGVVSRKSQIIPKLAQIASAGLV
ncbi:MAG: putative manganese-dependent inorganic diphosphatase [Defluviitaleaceae bacterium]|nr:putative manganese-dependent inorganic diphosphatase [Defluviitaleaceae bacterium]